MTQASLGCGDVTIRAPGQRRLRFLTSAFVFAVLPAASTSARIPCLRCQSRLCAPSLMACLPLLSLFHAALCSSSTLCPAFSPTFSHVRAYTAEHSPSLQSRSGCQCSALELVLPCMHASSYLSFFCSHSRVHRFISGEPRVSVEWNGRTNVGLGMGEIVYEVCFRPSHHIYVRF